MKPKVLNLDNKARRSIIDSRDAIFGLEPRADLIQRVRGLAARQAPRRHAQGDDPRRDQPHQQEDLQAEGHRPGPPRRGRAPLFVGGAGRWARSSTATNSTCPRRCARWPQARAVGQGEGRRHRRARRSQAARTSRPARWPSSFGKLGVANALVVDGAEFDKNFRSAARNLAEYRCCRCRHQRLRHHAARQAGADQGRGQSDRGALQMSHQRSAQLRRRSCRRSSPKRRPKLRAQPGRVPRRLDATKPQIKEAVERLFKVKVKA